MATKQRTKRSTVVASTKRKQRFSRRTSLLIAALATGFTGLALMLSTSAADQSIRFASYNVRTSTLNNNRWGDNNSFYDADDARRMKGIAKVIQDRGLSLLAAQEVREKERAGMLNNLSGWNATGVKDNGETVIFWRNDVWEIQGQAQTYRVRIDNDTTRPQVYALFQHKISKQKVYVFDVHYAAGDRANLRLEAAKESVAKIRATAIQNNIPFILAGDMNENDRVRGGVVDYLNSTGIMKYSRYVAKEKFHNDCDTHNGKAGLQGLQECGRANGGSHIDHVWVSQRQSVGVNIYNVYATSETSRISDHNPLITAISFSNN